MQSGYYGEKVASKLQWKMHIGYQKCVLRSFLITLIIWWATCKTVQKIRWVEYKNHKRDAKIHIQQLQSCMLFF